MIEDKISLALKDISKLKEEIREVKKDMRADEKIDNDQYIELKSAYKDLHGQLKDMKDEWEESLKKDESYNKLRELLQKKEEELANANKSLFDAVSKLPVKAVQMKMETEFGPVNIQIQPEMRVYVNGKEEKKRG
jgi:chromosome segregation ATPase